MSCYSLDSSALIHASSRAYPRDLFPTFWQKLEALTSAGRALVSQAVFLELKKKTDELQAWVKKRPEMVVPIDVEIQEVVAAILADKKCARLVDTKKGRSGADPFVIALAEVTGSIVVTEEPVVGLNAKSPRIPDVCNLRNVQYVNLVELIRREKWTF